MLARLPPVDVKSTRRRDFQAADHDYDVIVLSRPLAGDFDPLRLCSQLRAVDRTRFDPYHADGSSRARMVVSPRRLELGINDYHVPAT
jgi:two-component system cell cycle response regulator